MGLLRLPRGMAVPLVSMVLQLGISSQALAGEGDTSKPKVLTTVLPVYCFALNVAGDAATVENLLRAGTSAHDYQFTRRDIQQVSSADLILVNGLGLESWLDRLVTRAERKAPVVRVFEGVDDLLTGVATLGDETTSKQEHRHDHPQNQPNPHVWLDPNLAAAGVSNICSALQKADPRRASVYATNAANYQDRLRALDRELEEGLRPYRNQPIITHHDAFAYFARRFGLRVVGVIQPVAEVQPSPRYLADLQRLARAERVSALFTEPGSSDKLVRRMARDLGLTVAVLDPLETGQLAATAYEDGMRRNLAVLRQHLKPYAPSSQR